MKEQLDFYFSAKQAEIRRERRMPLIFFRDQQYTECCDKGESPMGKFDDYVFLGTGTDDDIKTGRQI